MIIEQTVEIPANGVLHLDIALPETASTESTVRVLIQIPEKGGETLPSDTPVSAEAKGQSRDEAFRRALRRAYGAWKSEPWENAPEDIRAMRNEWAHRDPWNPDPLKRHSTKHG
jgi:hypothetical protein